MSRSLPFWLLASVLAALIGCGGGDATDSGAVASNSNEAATSGGGAAMSTDDGGMGNSGDMMGSAGGADGDMGDDGSDAMMDMNMYDPSGESSGDDPATDSMEMMEAYGEGGLGYPGGGAGGEGADIDPAEMEAFYGEGADADPDGAIGASSEEMQELYGTGAGPGGEGAYPGGANPAGPDGDEAYPGGEYSGGPGGPGGGAVQEKVPEGFDGKAQLAFRRGKEKDAMQFLYAQALTTDAGAESILPGIRWVGGLRQPTLAVRWGVGFVVTAPPNFPGDPKPVGSQQKIPTRGGNRGDGAGGNEGFGGGDEGYGAAGGGDEGYGAEGGGGSNSLLSKGAGELGDKLAAAYTERVMRGDFGDVLKKASEAGSGGNRGNAYGEEDSEYGGGAGYGGPGGAGPGGAGPGYGAKAGPEGAGAGGGGAAAASEVTQIKPGLSMLGIGTQKELIERAREDGIDAIVIIDMKLSMNRSTGLVTNDSTLALLDAKTQKKLHTTRKFNNLIIQKARAAGKEDSVDKELGKLFEAIDANFKMTDLPAGLTAERAAQRVADLAAEQHDNPLPILAEARMYHAKGLLEESALFAAYEQILGVDFGRLLATGEEEDKKKVLNRWLPEI
jgi:hypothetical protein